jgi:hypothetical protein
MPEDIRINASNEDQSRPKERLSKSSWQLEFLKKLMRIVQYISPQLVAKVLWHYFSRPTGSGFTPAQIDLINQATISRIFTNGNTIFHYQWGDSQRRILLAHGWNSKISDFRKIINTLVRDGFQVEGIDMPGHGKSGGKHTSAGEMMDIISAQLKNDNTYEAMIGYSIGGLAGALAIAKAEHRNKPKQLILIAAPPYSKFIFEEVMDDLHFKQSVADSVYQILGKIHSLPIEEFDLRHAQPELQSLDITLIYDEDDTTITMEKGLLLKSAFAQAQFVRTSGLGHYKIISYQPVVNLISNRLLHQQASN